VVEEEQAKDSATTDLPDEPVEMYSDVFFFKKRCTVMLSKLSRRSKRSLTVPPKVGCRGVQGA
jgi:hypothetical protein